MSGYIGNIPVPQATQTRQSFTATASQTTFNTAGYSVGYVDVFLNGVKLAPADYTATNGSDIILAVGAASGDILEIVAYEIFQVVDQDFTGDFTVDGTTFVVDSTNNRIGIGTSSPTTALEVNGDITFGDGHTIGNDGGDNLKITSSTNESVVIQSSSGIHTWRDASDEYGRFDASGNLLVGKTSVGLSTTGIDLRSNGLLQAIRDGGTCVELNRQTSDGTIMDFRKDNSTVGSIGTAGGDLTIDGPSEHTGLRFEATDITPRHNGALSNGVNDLGTSSARFKDLYLSGGVYLGGTGSANKLDDYEEGTWTPTIAGGSGDPTVTYGADRGGYYIKIGRAVHLTGTVHWTALSGGSGTARIGGLPFAISSRTSGDNADGVNACRTLSWNGTSTEVPTIVHMYRGGSFLNIMSSRHDANAVTLTTSDLGTTGYISFNITIYT